MDRQIVRQTDRETNKKVRQIDKQTKKERDILFVNKLFLKLYI
jgi:hypothetical protein